MPLSYRLILPAFAALSALALASHRGAYSPAETAGNQAFAANPHNLGVNVGTTFCDPMDPNSTGLPTVLSGTLNPGVGSGLHLDATQGPVGQFGYFRIGTAMSDPGVMVGQGHMCLSIFGGNVYGRYTVPGILNSIGRFDADGDLANLAGTSTSGFGFDVPVEVP
ncbi:MAG TPA: hypothetical protein P5218_05655, partial [Planctomycetota bacterium]|nr:hypothetical protein [Planctomycetota bacterium]